MKPFDKNETIAKWKQDYPQMPDLFHQAVTEELRRHFEEDDLSDAAVQPGSGRQGETAAQSGSIYQDNGASQSGSNHQNNTASDLPSNVRPENMLLPGQITWESSSASSISGTGRGRKRRLSRLLLLPAAAALLGFTALAGSGLWRPESYSQEETEFELAADFQLCRIFPQALNTPEAAAQIQTDPTVTVLDAPPEYVRTYLPETYDSLPKAGDAPLIDIKEVMCDGERLYMYMETTEAGREYSMVLHDAFYIDQAHASVTSSEYFNVPRRTDSGVSRRSFALEEAEPFTSSDEFGFYAHFSEPIKEDFQIILSFAPRQPVPNVSEDTPIEERWTKYQNQYLAFTVKVFQTPADIPDQCFEYAEFNMELGDLSYSVTSHLQGTVRLYMTEEQLASYLEYPTPGRHFTLLLITDTSPAPAAPEDTLSSEHTGTDSKDQETVIRLIPGISLGSIAEGCELPFEYPIPSPDEPLTLRILEQTLWFGGNVKDETVYGEDELDLRDYWRAFLKQ